jgi:hypothetical protein
MDQNKKELVKAKEDKSMNKMMIGTVGLLFFAASLCGFLYEFRFTA